MALESESYDQHCVTYTAFDKAEFACSARSRQECDRDIGDWHAFLSGADEEFWLNLEVLRYDFIP